MRIGLLGPLTVTDDDGERTLASAKERSLLASLALTPDQAVSVEGLIDALWGDEAPVTARKTLQTYVSNLRRALGADVIVTDAFGYRLGVDVAEVDVAEFRDLVRRGEEAMSAGSFHAARAFLAQAVTLWRGEPLHGVAQHTGLAAAAVRLREEYLTALEAALGAELACGNDAELVGQLEGLVREHPYRERLWGHLMLALYRSGRQADALAAYTRARRILQDDLGLEPGGELQRLERAVLNQDSALDRPPLGHVVVRSAVRYAVASDGVHIAYQVVGNGPVDVVAVPGFVSHLDMWWNAPTDRLVRQLGSFSRLILFDKRGMGLSDRPDAIEPEQWVDDTMAVVQAAGCERAVILGISAGVPTATLFAAQYPGLVRSLILYGGYPRFLLADDYPIGVDRATVDSFISNMEANWGTGVGMSILAPSRAHDPEARAYWARLQVTSASPRAAATFLRALSEIDVRRALPTINAPTLVVHATRDRNASIEGARLMRDLIPGARLVELDSDIHLLWLSDVVDEVTEAICDFVVGEPPAEEAVHALTTILAVTPGDVPRPVVERAVARFRGRMPHGGMRAMFDGPAQAIKAGCAVIAASEGARVGVHSGECDVSGGGVCGPAVDVADQLAASAQAGQVLVSRTITDLVVGSTLRFDSRGRQRFAGVPEDWEVFAVRPTAQAVTGRDGEPGRGDSP